MMQQLQYNVIINIITEIDLQSTQIESIKMLTSRLHIKVKLRIGPHKDTETHKAEKRQEKKFNKGVYEKER